MQQKRLACFQEISSKKCDDDMFVHLTIYDIPASLLRDFCKKTVQPNYSGGGARAKHKLQCPRLALNSPRTSKLWSASRSHIF